jgi:hypothetical protein
MIFISCVVITIIINIPFYHDSWWSRCSDKLAGDGVTGRFDMGGEEWCVWGGGGGEIEKEGDIIVENTFISSNMQ